MLSCFEQIVHAILNHYLPACILKISRRSCDRLWINLEDIYLVAATTRLRRAYIHAAPEHPVVSSR